MPRGNDPHRRQRSSAGCVTARPPRKIRELRASLFELVFPVARSGTAEHTALCYPVETELGKVARIDSCTTPPALTGDSTKTLPTIMGERFIRFGHLVRVFPLLDGIAAAVRRIHDLARQLVLHRLLSTRVSVRDQPADGQRRWPSRASLDGNLIG